MGPRDDVNVSASVTYQLPKLASTPYPWYYPARNYMDLPNKIYSVPESGLVAIQLTMPLNATSISLTVSDTSFFLVLVFSFLVLILVEQFLHF